MKFMENSVFQETIKREKYISELDTTLTGLDSEVKVALGNLFSYLNNRTISKDIEKEVIDLGKNIGITASKAVEVVNQLRLFSMELSDNGSILSTLAVHNLPVYITDKTLNVRSAGIIGTIANYSSMVLYLSDLSVYLTYIVSGDELYYPKKKEMVKSLSGAFLVLYVTYNTKSRKIMDDLAELSITELGDIESLGIAMRPNDHKFSLPINNFIGNPIYHVRIWIEEIKFSRYEWMKEQRTIVELKLLELRARESMKPNSIKTGEVKYHEERLRALEEKITKFERI